MTVLLAEANSQSETIRGKGDAERNRIFADAYGKDPNFFAFYRSMQAYERSMQHSDTRLVLRPDSDFFRYFGDPGGKVTDGAATSSGAAAATAPTPPRATSATK